MDTELSVQLSELKNVIYVDKVYRGVAELRRRALEGPQRSLHLGLSELRVFSQNGEDGVINHLIGLLPEHEPYFVEFGVGDGWSCNTRFLAEVLGWSGLYIEADKKDHECLVRRYKNSSRITTRCAEVDPENINSIFESAEVPHEFTVLSIDIDGQDYWVWEALAPQYRPSIVVIEVNTNFPPDVAVTERRGTPQRDLTESFGASLQALAKLGQRKGYELAYVEAAGVNAFFIRTDLRANLDSTGPCDRSPNYGLRGQFHAKEVLYQSSSQLPRPIEVL